MSPSARPMEVLLPANQERSRPAPPLTSSRGCRRKCDRWKRKLFKVQVRRLDAEPERLRPWAKYKWFRHSDIFRRDGWDCQICGKPVRRDVKHPHPHSASIDHIKPVALGGDHTPENVRCAHLGCNQRRRRTDSAAAQVNGCVKTRLHIDGKSLARALELVSSLIPNSELRAANDANRAKLHWREVDRYTLAIHLCTDTLNSLTEDATTGLEESPVEGIMGMLKHLEFGRQAYGTVVRVARELLVGAHLLYCTDASYERGDGNYQGPTGQCRKWIPVGQAWSLPFISDIEDRQLSPAQRASREAFLLQVQRHAEQDQQIQSSRAFEGLPRHSPYYDHCADGLHTEWNWEGMAEDEIAPEEYDSYQEAILLGL